MSPSRSQPAVERWATNLLTWAGSLLVVGSAVIHYYLWAGQGYRHIPTIGPLFIAQAVVGVVLAIATVLLRKLSLLLAEVGYAFSSAGGLIISVNFGLFGWQESMSAPYAGLALGVELAAGALLLPAALLLTRHRLSMNAKNIHRLGALVSGAHADAAAGVHLKRRRATTRPAATQRVKTPRSPQAGEPA